ncbi:MAG: DinB family protein [Flavobacterium sp.]|uniref:DinB family protein n=1 Tax=Flavobacterium sp. TaxID=239 RepID=UPI0011F816CC|nr:DinB family protein [Flavobacterium sp.]RZJ68306.1 MAG: DinB family protein [Flavobacterium sp.]
MSKGAVTALLEIYSNAIDDLKRTISVISDEKLVEVTDVQTDNPDCISIQTVLTHVVSSGFGYATTILNRNGDVRSRPPRVALANSSQYRAALDEVIRFTFQVFEDISDEDLEVFEESSKMLTNWGQRYDIEQLMEHAIVHILRHHRQIKNFLTR